MESEFKAQIFSPRNGFDWRLNSSRLYLGGFISLISFLIFAQTFDFNHNFVQGISLLLLIMIVIGSKWGYNEKQNKFGILEGELKISDELISINDTEYPWNKVSNFNFNLLLVLDEQLWSDTYPIGRYYGGPAFSQGVDNYLEFLFENEQLKVFFQLETPSHKVKLTKILKRHFFMGHIELQQTYDGLHLEYDQIQELKRQKSEWIDEKSS